MFNFKLQHDRRSVGQFFLVPPDFNFFVWQLLRLLGAGLPHPYPPWTGWSSPKSKVKVTLVQGEICNVTIGRAAWEACSAWRCPENKNPKLRRHDFERQLSQKRRFWKEILKCVARDWIIAMCWTAKKNDTQMVQTLQLNGAESFLKSRYLLI
jgi:hypothetical protein